MSKLGDDATVNCYSCQKEMKEIMLCKSRRRIDNTTTRCITIICSECVYCEFCDRRIHELQYQLRKYKYGMNDEKTEQCKQFVRELENNHKKY